MPTIREKLFKDMQGCTNHGCVIRGKFKGIGTNAMCSCVVNMSRGQLQLLQSRIKVIAEIEVSDD